MVKCTYLYDLLEYREYIVDIEKSKEIMISSREKIKFKCPNCDNIKEMMVTSFVNRGLSCDICSTNISYPELFFLAVNKHFNLKFKYQQTYVNGRFDFINHDTKVIVEMNGLAHYEECNIMDYKATLESDNKKRKWAEENGYTLIFIDARKSEFKFIKDNINKEELLPNIHLKDETNILNIIENNKRYDVKNIISMYENGCSLEEIGEFYNTSRSTVASILKKMNIVIRKSGHYKRKPRHITQEEIEVISLVEDGLTVTEIVSITKIAKSRIYKIIKNNNLKINKRSKNYFKQPPTIY